MMKLRNHFMLITLGTLLEKSEIRTGFTYCDLIAAHGNDLRPFTYEREAVNFIKHNYSIVLEAITETGFYFEPDCHNNYYNTSNDDLAVKLANLTYYYVLERFYFDIILSFKEETGNDIFDEHSRDVDRKIREEFINYVYNYNIERDRVYYEK